MRLAASSFVALLLAVDALAQTQLSEEDAYNPIPSPDGTKIAAVRTGWFRPGGSGGLGRSNLVSEIILLDRAGRTLSRKPLSDGFAGEWKKEGIVSFRDWSYALLAEDGSILRHGGVVCPPQPGPCEERVAYLSKAGSFVWARQAGGDLTLMTAAGALSPRSPAKRPGIWLAPSPDERFIAVGPGRPGESLSIYDTQAGVWFDFGKAMIHPDELWNWMEASWDPWFADGSRLAYFTADGLMVSSADGSEKRVVLRVQEPAGLAVPSPDGRAVAYATFASRPRTSGGGNLPVWNCTGIYVVDLERPARPRRLTGESQASTYGLRWVDDRHLVFDRVEDGIPRRARLWTIEVER